MRVAALYDVHGNLPALEAALHDVRAAGVDHIVVGGDVLPGPMPSESIATLLGLDISVQCIRGNGDLAVLAQIAAQDPGEVAYWGTASGKPLPEAVQRQIRWTADQLRPDQAEALRSWPATVRLRLPRLGAVLFCHGTPRSETETFTSRTRADLLEPVFRDLDADVVVCGHTHMQFDRVIGGVRVVNAGSVGMPFGPPGADWLLLDDDVHFMHTSYDLAAAADRVRTTDYPQATDFAVRSILEPPSAEAMLEALTSASFR